MDNEVKRLQEEVDKLRSQLYVFYELTKAMRTTLRLDEITYIILTGLTAHEGLRFNRAAIFFIDEKNKKIDGFMGLGPIDGEEASQIWQNIESENKDLYDLIQNYHQMKENKVESKFMELIKSFSFGLNDKNSIISKLVNKKVCLRFKENQLDEFKDDPFIKKLNLGEFLACSLWIKGKVTGIVVVDNYITKKPITEDDIKIFEMFMEQSSGALENSQSFESTLTKAHTDPLTSLWNHGYFQYKLDEELSKAAASGLPLSVMMMDLDDFKKFNDACGHIQGDRALKKIAEIIKENCRKIDIVCRYGGEEFVLILPANKKKEAKLLAQRIRESIANTKILEHRFSLSIGVATFPEDASQKLDLVQKADQALYQAKNKGKNRVVLA